MRLAEQSSGVIGVEDCREQASLLIDLESSVGRGCRRKGNVSICWSTDCGSEEVVVRPLPMLIRSTGCLGLHSHLSQTKFLC